MAASSRLCRSGARACALLLLSGSAQSPLRRKLTVRRRVGSWQLAAGSWQLDVAIANGPSFHSAMAENVTIDGDVVCATSSSLLTAPSWSSRDWWMVDGLLRLLWRRWSSERTRWSEGFWVLGSGFCLDSVSTRSEWSAPPRAVKGKSTEYVRRMGLPPTTAAWLRLDGFGIFALRQYPRTWT